MKRFFVIIFIALTGAGMLCATEPNTNKTIKIHSVGEVEVIPDMATFTSIVWMSTWQILKNVLSKNLPH